MPRYEYKVVPAPNRGLKGKGVKGPEARFSYAIQELMNGLAGYGWEYVRAETLPSIERSGLTSTTTEWRNVLVFRRLRENDADAFAPELLPAPDQAQPATVTPDRPASEPVSEAVSPARPEEPATAATAIPEGGPAKTEQAADNGVEDPREMDGVGSSPSQLAANRKEAKTEA